MFKVERGDEIYTKALEREAKTWGEELSVETRRRRPRYHPIVQRYQNSLITGSPNMSWMEFIKRRYGEFRRACSLGVGVGFIEEKLLDLDLFEELEIIELSSQALDKFKSRLTGKAYFERISFRQADLNFVELPGERYDFVLCNTILHHIVNLEWLIYQINKSLVKDGILLVVDFIGESKFQWSDRRIALTNALLDFIPPDYGRRRLTRRAISEMNKRSPFEAIRSAEILGILSKVMSPIRVKPFCWLLFPLINIVLASRDWNDPVLNRILEVACQLDNLVGETKALEPTHVLAEYRKSDSTVEELSVTPWTEEQIRTYLGAEFRAEDEATVSSIAKQSSGIKGEIKSIVLRLPYGEDLWSLLSCLKFGWHMWYNSRDRNSK